MATTPGNPSPHQPLLVYIYWDNLNLFIEAQHMADRLEREEFGDNSQVQMLLSV
jgi:hypothetical protein